GGQTPFTNLTFDWVVPEDLKNEKVIYGGQRLDATYSDFQKEMDMINKAFLEVMEEGDMNGRVFTFPIPTYNITSNFNWDSENAKVLFEMTAKYGLPYFQNFINSDLNPSDVRSMCCRLQLDLRELRNKTGGLFGAGESTGSIGVVTINLPRLGYLSKTKTEFFERLENLMELAKFSLEIKRSIVNKNLEAGLLPYTKRYLKSLDSHFSTIGLLGMNETVTNFMDTDITSPEGKAFAAEVLDFMRNKIQDFQTETGNIYNLEATPAEGTSYRLARLDKSNYPDIKTMGTDEPYYTNSSALPVNYTQDIFEALDHQDELQTKYTGGTVMHIFLGESLYDGETCKMLIKRVAEKYHLPYYTVTPTFSICKNHGYIRGEHFKCPECGGEAEVYSRVVGYFRPVQNWNKGKKEEFKDRKYFVYQYSQTKAS
ncbi:MAG: ribonucleoside triphosphate reductase, partial [Bacteroidales bacterium]